MYALQIASQLTYLAVTANFSSILTILICCAAIILFIRQFRLHEFELTGSSIIEVKQPAQEQFLAKVNLPFCLEIGMLESKTLGNHHLTLYSTSYFPCLFVVCSEMSADMVKILVNEPWCKFIERFNIPKTSLFNVLIYAEEGVHSSKPFSIESPISRLPRLAYAVVTFHIRTDVECIEDEVPAAIITILHIPDDYCNAPATALCRYLKCKGGRVLNLKPLYSQEQGTNVGKEDSRQGLLEKSNVNCTVCWNFPTTHVLLPCRHACLCANCFKRVKNCPVCRSRIVSFFLI